MVSKRYATTRINPIAGSCTLTRISSIVMLCHDHRVFRWLDENEVHTFDVQTVADDSEKGYVLDLHNHHNAYPLGPERLMVCTEWNGIRPEPMDGSIHRS